MFSSSLVSALVRVCGMLLRMHGMLVRMHGMLVSYWKVDLPYKLAL